MANLIVSISIIVAFAVLATGRPHEQRGLVGAGIKDKHRTAFDAHVRGENLLVDGVAYEAVTFKNSTQTTPFVVKGVFASKAAVLPGADLIGVVMDSPTRLSLDFTVTTHTTFETAVLRFQLVTLFTSSPVETVTLSTEMDHVCPKKDDNKHHCHHSHTKTHTLRGLALPAMDDSKMKQTHSVTALSIELTDEKGRLLLSTIVPVFKEDKWGTEDIFEMPAEKERKEEEDEDSIFEEKDPLDEM